MTRSRDRDAGLGTGTTVPPLHCSSLSRCWLSLGFSAWGVPNSVWTPQDPIKPLGQLSPAGLYFWEATGTAIPWLGTGTGAAVVREGPVGAGRQRVHAAETGREAPPPPSLIFSNDRSRSLGQVAKAAEPPHAPRHAACKTSEQEGWKPYRIIQGKASCPAPAQPRRREGQGERSCCGPSGEWGRAVAVLGRKMEIESIWSRHAAFGLREG